MQRKSSIDPNEAKKFNDLSTSWWNRQGAFKILHQINPLRLKFITDKIDQHFKDNIKDYSISDLKILDVGCGGGLVSIPLAQIGAQVTGIDAGINNINSCVEQASLQNLQIDFLHSSAEEIVTSSQRFDVVLCLEVIEHVVNIEEFVRNLSILVKQGGMLIISTINRNLKSYLQAIIAAEYILKWVPKKTHTYDKFLKPSELNNLLINNKMIVKELVGLKYSIKQDLWYLSNNIDVNYFAYVTKNDKD